MANGINYTGDLQRYVLDRLFDNLTDKCWPSKQSRYASNNHSRDQVDISTDNQSIFDGVCDVGDWEIYRIPGYADDEIRTAI